MPRGKALHYSEGELQWIKEHRTLPRKDAHRQFCEKFERNDVSLTHYNALCKRNGWLTGRDGRIAEGATPWNKGKEWTEGEGAKHPNARKTQFKKGRAPHNTKYLGHERLNKEGYIEISVDEINPHTGYGRRHVLKHKYLWEKTNGKLPKGMCLKCLDGNRQNTDPANWAPIPRGALPFLNGHRGYNYEDMPKELKPAVLTLAKVRHAKSKAVKRKQQSSKPE